MSEAQDRPQWLPPEPPGRPPALGSAGGSLPPPAHQWPPAQAPPQGYPPQPPAYPPPGYASPYGYVHPPAAAHPPAGSWPPPAYWPPAQQFGPGNDAAVASLILSISGAALLLFSSGFAAPITLVLGILGIVYGRKGRKKVDAGETIKHRSLAQAGFVVGIVAIVLSVLALLLWTAVIVLAIAADDEDGGGLSPDGTQTDARLALAALAVRFAAVLS